MGATDPSLIQYHKRLKAYDAHDFGILNDCITMSGVVVWCPNVLTETSNLLGRSGHSSHAISNTFATLARAWRESYVPSSLAVERPEYERLGLTDAVLLALAGSNATLLTADLDLHLAACAAGLPSINFNELRDERPDFN